MSSNSAPIDDTVHHDMVANEPGTLMQHGVTYKDGKRYSIGRDGSLRHTHPQFKGSKKNKRRFMRRVSAALEAAVPDGYVELKSTDQLVALDLLMNVLTGKWECTPYIQCTLDQLQLQFAIWPRACRKSAEVPKP